MDEHTDIHKLGSFYRDIDEDGNFIDARKERKLASNLAIVTGRKRIRRRIYQGHYVLLQPTSLIRTTSLRALGGYREVFHAVEDNDMYLRMLDRYGAVLENHSDCLYYYRRYRASISNRISTGEQARLLVLTHYSSDCRLRGRADPLEGAKSLSLDELAIPAEDCSYLEGKIFLDGIASLPTDKAARRQFYRRIDEELAKLDRNPRQKIRSCIIVAVKSLRVFDLRFFTRYFFLIFRVNFLLAVSFLISRVCRYFVYSFEKVF